MALEGFAPNVFVGPVWVCRSAGPSPELRSSKAPAGLCDCGLRVRPRSPSLASGVQGVGSWRYREWRLKHYRKGPDSSRKAPLEKAHRESLVKETSPKKKKVP